VYKWKCQKILDEVYNAIINKENKGNVASCISKLIKVNADNFGIHLNTVNGNEYGVGD